MSFGAAFQLHNRTNSLASCIDHLEGLGNFAYLQHVDGLGHFGWQVGQLEARGAQSVLCYVEHQAVIVARILVVGDNRCSRLEGELAFGNIRTDRIQSVDSLCYRLVTDDGLAQDVAHFYLVAALVYQLDDMVAKLRLHNLGHTLGVAQAEGDIGKSRVEGCSWGIVQFAAAPRRTWVFRIHARQRLERSLALVDAVSIFAQLFLDAVDFLLFDAGLLGDNLHLNLGRYEGQTVLRHILKVVAHLGRGDGNVLDQFLLHALYHLALAIRLAQVGTYLAEALLLILLQLLSRADDGNHVLHILLYALGNLRLGHLHTVDDGLIEIQLLHGNLLGDSTVGVTFPVHTFLLPLNAHGFHVGFQDGLVSHHPDDLIDNGSDAVGLSL